jgi:LmbE family N-acetylglucosaminyl deacetylase
MNVLVVAAHPDDEVLGCGGTMARHAAAGDNVDLLILAEEITSRDSERDAAARAAELDDLREAAGRAAMAIGAQAPAFGGLPDQRLDTLPILEIAKHVEQFLLLSRPEVVYTHHGGDLNADHRIVHQAVLTAARPLPGSTVRLVCGWETLSSTEWNSPAVGPPFMPQRYVELTPAHLDRKLASLQCYQKEMRPFPHPRSFEAVQALARLRGAQSGLNLAEAFTVLRHIV